jgi:hypothetical protein
MTNLKNKSRKLKRSLKIKRRLSGGDCNGVVRNRDSNFWPINSGCVGNNNVITRLQVGTIIDRFGEPTGRTLCPVNAGVPYPYEARAIPFIKMGDFRTQSNCRNEYETYAQQNYHQYKVTKPFDVFVCDVKHHRFNNDAEQEYEGGAVQYTLTVNSITNAEKSTIPGFQDLHVPIVQDMLDFKYLEKVAPIRQIPRFRTPKMNPDPIPKQDPIPNPDPNQDFHNMYNDPYLQAGLWGGGKRRRSVKRRQNKK